MPTVQFGGGHGTGEHFSIVKHNLDSLNGVKDEAGDIFAVFKVSGSQVKATLDDVIITNKLKDGSGHLKVGTTIEFEDVLLVGTKTQTIVGRPVIPRAKVVATVEEQTRDKKIIVFKKKKRKGYKKKQGHRSYITSMRILDIVVDDSMKA
jgi:large subunit ribosomal protein L21